LKFQRSRTLKIGHQFEFNGRYLAERPADGQERVFGVTQSSGGPRWMGAVNDASERPGVSLRRRPETGAVLNHPQHTHVRETTMKQDRLEWIATCSRRSGGAHYGPPSRKMGTGHRSGAGLLGANQARRRPSVTSPNCGSHPRKWSGAQRVSPASSRPAVCVRLCGRERREAGGVGGPSVTVRSCSSGVSLEP